MKKKPTDRFFEQRFRNACYLENKFKNTLRRSYIINKEASSSKGKVGSTLHKV